MHNSNDDCVNVAAEVKELKKKCKVDETSAVWREAKVTFDDVAVCVSLQTRIQLEKFSVQKT